MGQGQSCEPEKGSPFLCCAPQNVTGPHIEEVVPIDPLQASETTPAFNQAIFAETPSAGPATAYSPAPPPPQFQNPHATPDDVKPGAIAEPEEAPLTPFNGEPEPAYVADSPPPDNGAGVLGDEEGPSAGPVGPRRWRIEFQRDPDVEIGIQVSMEPGATYLTLGAVDPGKAIALYNASNPRTALKPGDRIINISGIGGNCRALLKQLARAKDNVTIDIERISG